MSIKLPVGAVVNETVQFGLHRWTSFVRFGWLPLVVLSFVGAGLFAGAIDLDALSAVDEGTDSAAALGVLREALRVPLPVFGLLGIVYVLAGYFLLGGVYASVYRLAALGEERPGFFHLRMDGPAIRVFCALVISGLVSLAIFGLACLLTIIITGDGLGVFFGAFKDFVALAMEAEASGSQPVPSPELNARLAQGIPAFFLLMIFTIIPNFYASIKLAPFAPGSAVENRLILFKSFRMTFGHAWSIFSSFLLYGSFIVIVTIIGSLALKIFELMASVLIGQGGGLAVLGGIIVLVVAVARLCLQAFTASTQLALQAIIYRRIETGE